MLPKAPKLEAGSLGIEAYRAGLRDVASSLRNRFDREFFRKELASRAKYYATLCDKRPNDCDSALHFKELARVHQEVLEAFGPERAPKKRKAHIETAPLKYPELPDELTHRVHFLASGSLRRERAAALSGHADAVSSQQCPNGDVLLSVAVHPKRVRFFERLIESTGADGLGPSIHKAGGFSGYVGTGGRLVSDAGWHSQDSPWRRMYDDNFCAGLHHWSLRRDQLPPSIQLPEIPAIPESLPWDPDPRFNEILSLTQTDRLFDALKAVESIPAEDRVVLFDEVLYLRYLVNESPKGDDLRYLARKHIAGSSIRARLEDEFEAYIAYFDTALADAGPIPDDFPGFATIDEIHRNDPDPLKRNTPPLKDWCATRAHYYRQYEAYGHPVRPRGRIFVWHPDIGSGSLTSLLRAFAPELAAAENRFRRDRSIAEIGRGWASETALVDLVRSVYSDAVHQWRPPFLGFQSVDIFIPSLNLAIEYQGEQHYRSVEIFGGEEGLEATTARDARKRSLLATNGVRLFEWRFDRPVSWSELESVLAKFGT